jgi:hypothetical protein
MLSAKMTTKRKPSKRPADVVSNAVHVMRVLTGETDDVQPVEKNKAAQELGQRGGVARSKSVSARRRSEIARKAAKTRWKIKKE